MLIINTLVIYIYIYIYIVQVITVKWFQVIVLKINALINMGLVIFFYNRVVFWALEGRAMLQIQTNIKGRPHYSVKSI